MTNDEDRMTKRGLWFWVVLLVVWGGVRALGGTPGAATRAVELGKIVLDYDTATDAGLGGGVEGLEGRWGGRFGMTEAQTAAGVMDLRTGRLAIVRGDREEYAASVAKIGILLA